MKTKLVAALMGAMLVYFFSSLAIRAVGTAALGILLFAEPASAVRLGCIGLIVAGVVVLKTLSRSGGL